MGPPVCMAWQCKNAVLATGEGRKVWSLVGGCAGEAATGKTLA